jgi:hypothetical protein
LKLFAFFHLNLAFSSIEEEQRATVVERCYWPLLRLAREYELPLGIEATGYTLEAAAALDPEWVAELRRLVTDGPCEFVGSGYVQLIGPLVPADVNAANLRLGMQSYERLLGLRPRVALINEQAYSAGLVPLYREAGYDAVIMEWNNPARAHADWNPDWRYLPQYACGPDGETIPLIWNKSIAFQKFQRYAHGEMEPEEYLGYLRGHAGPPERAFPLYGNDAETFDFRPGRFMTEAPVHGEGEWQRIAEVFRALREEPGMEFIRPEQVLDLLDRPGAGNRLRLESAAQPTPVKKQDKYNLVRWAVTGRDDLGINTGCWRVFRAMQSSGSATDEDWRELCYLWSSDFRTHITERRWEAYLRRLHTADETWMRPAATSRTAAEATWRPLGGPSVERQGRFLQIEGERLRVRLNCQRGLALDWFVDRAVGDQPLCGTLHHGYYDDIRWGADYYTGHLVFESPGRPKLTDLNPVELEVERLPEGVRVSARVETLLGAIEKAWLIDDLQGRLQLSYRFDLPEQPGLGSLRLGHITLFPEAFDPATLYYRTHNGGTALETFPLAGAEVDHGQAVSFLVSASHAIGITEGLVELGDARRRLRIEVDKARSAVIGLVSHRTTRDQFFTRLTLSAQELDDTSRGGGIRSLEGSIWLSARSSGHNHERP